MQKYDSRRILGTGFAVEELESPYVGVMIGCHGSPSVQLGLRTSGCRIHSKRNRPSKLFESGDAEYRMESLAVDNDRVIFV